MASSLKHKNVSTATTRESHLQAIPSVHTSARFTAVCALSSAILLSTIASYSPETSQPHMIRRSAATTGPRVIDHALTVGSNDDSTNGPEILQLTLNSKRTRARRHCRGLFAHRAKVRHFAVSSPSSCVCGCGWVCVCGWATSKSDDTSACRPPRNFD